MYLLILGANSDIALAIGRKFAKEERANLYLASRDMDLLHKRALDLGSRYGVEVKVLHFDATDYTSHASFYGTLEPKPDGVVVAFGYLGDQVLAQRDFQEANRIIGTNYTGVVSILEVIAAEFEKRGHGFIVGISSVAGERGRKSNYLYGSAKGGFTAYLSGLRNRLFQKRIRVLTVLAGFVSTKMTEDLKMPSLLVAEPDVVAEDIYRAFKKKKDIIYSKWYWRWIMFIIKAMPEFIFKRTSL